MHKYFRVVSLSGESMILNIHICTCASFSIYITFFIYIHIKLDPHDTQITKKYYCYIYLDYEIDNHVIITRVI